MTVQQTKWLFGWCADQDPIPLFLPLHCCVKTTPNITATDPKPNNRLLFHLFFFLFHHQN